MKMPIFSRSWLMKMKQVFDRATMAVSLRRAWDISRACRPMWASPLSPSTSALGTGGGPGLLAGGLGSVDLDAAAARKPADAQGQVEGDRAGRDGLDGHRGPLLA